MTWRIAAASVIGSAHLVRDLPCQDAHAYRLLADGTLVVAVADGAGSAARAEDGARLAAEAAVERLVAEIATAEDSAVIGRSGTVGRAAGLAHAETVKGPGNPGGTTAYGGAEASDWPARMTAVFRGVRELLEEKAIVEWEPLRAFACTLTCAVATADRLVIGQVGDGVAVARAVDGTLFAASRPQKGEYANEALFLTMPDALEHVETGVFEQPIDALALTTDGLLRLALRLPEHSPHRPFFDPLLGFAARAADADAAHAALTDFLSSPRICARTDDDKTLVIAVRAPAAAEKAPASVEPAPVPVEQAQAGVEPASVPVEPIPPGVEQASMPVEPAPARARRAPRRPRQSDGPGARASSPHSPSARAPRARGSP